jgi:hypothetical protein
LLQLRRNALLLPRGGVEQRSRFSQPLCRRHRALCAEVNTQLAIPPKQQTKAHRARRFGAGQHTGTLNLRIGGAALVDCEIGSSALVSSRGSRNAVACSLQLFLRILMMAQMSR